MPFITTLHPASANARAKASPMPPVEPVMRAVLPLRFVLIASNRGPTPKKPGSDPFRHVVVRHALERLHQRRVVPLRAAVGDTRIEELLRGGGVGQRHAHGTGARECERKIFL